MARRKLLKEKITRLKRLVDDDAINDWDIDEVTVFDDKITEVWGEFISLFEEILSTCPAAEEDLYQLQFYGLSTRFDELKVTVKRKIRQLQNLQSQMPDIRRNSREFRQNEVTVKLR
ncbi:unnamed protein product [Allacma fusca]|uniref:Uncharacterized protein n=1 Tax=Allacma fusca TaxID=39272 RepID=A0A8J2JCB7_9HEXA|nr:unnamed protein product [Allacma fusca]